MNKLKDLMVDIETLGTKTNSVVTQIGACFFDRETAEIGETFSVNIQIQDCLNKGLEIDEGALRFWFNQPQRTFLDDPVSLAKALGRFRTFYYKVNKKALIWSHATFDVNLLANAYYTIGESTPFCYRNTRDIRTLVDLANLKWDKNEETTNEQPHDALSDALYQVAYCCKAFRMLKGDNNA